MSRFVAVHHLSKAFKHWDHESLQITDEFRAWWYENETLIKKVHTEKNFELDANVVLLEFHSEEEALICRLTFG
jgi:thiamine kinase-like enzyme